MIWTEVEAKIKIENPIVWRERIKEIADFKKVQNKKDNYYALSKKDHKMVRVREIDRITQINFKRPISYKNGIHAKTEIEFETPNRKIIELLNEFGFKKFITKSKITELYSHKKYKNINIEINNVKKLGWFLEIEGLCKKSQVGKTRKKIEKILKILKVKKSQVEKKGYTTQLKELE